MSDIENPPAGEIEYRRETDTYQGSFDPRETEPSTAVVEFLAAIRHADPVDMEPLYHSVDTDALDSLFTAQTGTDVTVEFEVEGFVVTVGSGGTIEIDAPT